MKTRIDQTALNVSITALIFNLLVLLIILLSSCTQENIEPLDIINVQGLYQAVGNDSKDILIIGKHSVRYRNNFVSDDLLIKGDSVLFTAQHEHVTQIFKLKYYSNQLEGTRQKIWLDNEEDPIKVLFIKDGTN